MKAIPVLVFALALCLSNSCTSTPEVEDVSNPLVGVWEMVSGEYSMKDSTLYVPNDEFPDLKSMKIFSEGYFTTLHQNGPMKHTTLAGTYEIGDGEYTQTNTFASKEDNIGKSITMKFKIEDDKLIQESDWHKEVWKRVE